MEAQQTIIIEASRQTSIENNANLQQTNSAWTNRIEPTLFKKGDYVSVNTAIVNQKGASGANNIEFSDQYNDPTNNLQQNFTLLNVGFYLNNNNVNSVPLPYKYLKANSARTNPEKVADHGGRSRIFYSNDKFKQVDGNKVINNDMGMAEWYQIFANNYSSLTAHTADSLASFTSMNPFIKIDGSRYAKVGNTYKGWNRPYNGVVGTKAELLTQDIPLHIEKGFKDASSVGQTLTRILQSTNDPYSITAEYAKPESTLATLEPNEIAQKQVNPRFNGYCMKTVGANLQPYKNGVLSETEGALGNSALYNNLFTSEPFLWEYGTQMLSNMDIFNVRQNPLINENYDALKPHVTYDYPMLLWSTYESSLFDNDSLNNEALYDVYSPHFTEAVDTENGENALDWTLFSGIMEDYNDFYTDLTDYSEDGDYYRGSFVMKNSTNTYHMILPENDASTPKDPDDANKYLAFRTFIDRDNPAFDRITAFSMKNDLESSEWSILGEQIIDWTWGSFSYSGVDADDYFSETNKDGGGAADYTFYIENFIGGITEYKYIYNFVPYANHIKEGRKYRVSFIIEQLEGTTYNTFEFGLVDRTATFGFPGIDVDSGDNGGVPYSVEFTATADNSSVAAFMFYFKNNNTQYNDYWWKVSEFTIWEYDIEEGDQYTVSDIFTKTTALTTKIYKLKINNGQLRNEKVNVVNSAILADFNNQYTGYAKLRAYTSAGSLIAYDGINPNDFDDAALMIYRGDLNNDYIIYNQYGSKVWRLAEVPKFEGNSIVSGTNLGLITYSGTLKNPYRTGQQYYDFSVGNGWSGTKTPIVKKPIDAAAFLTDFQFSPITGSNTIFKIVGPYVEGTFDVIGDAGLPAGNYYMYDLLDGVGIVLGKTYTISFTTTHIAGTGSSAAYSHPLGILDRTAVFGMPALLATQDDDYTMTFTATASYAPNNGVMFYLQHGAPTGQEVRVSNFMIQEVKDVDFTSHIADPLPTVDGGKEYFASIVLWSDDGRTQTTYYLGANHNGEGDDTDKEGERGRVMYLAGGVWTTQEWHWGGALVLDMADPTITLTATSTPTITNIIEYETKQDRTIEGVVYSFPINGKQYGLSYNAGESTLVTDLHMPLPVSDVSVDEVYLGVDSGNFNNGYQSGYVYEDENENDVNNAIANWAVEFNQHKCILSFFDKSNPNIVLLTLEEGLSNITRYGWRVFKSSKFNYETEDLNQVLTIQGSENYYSGVRVYSDVGAGAYTGRVIPNGSHDFPNDTGTSTYLENQNIERYHANMPKHTMLMTNIKYTMANLKMLKDFYRYTEVYSGNVESSRQEIVQDVDNFYTTLDLGRSDDSKLQVDNTEAPYMPSPYEDIATVPLYNFTMKHYGAMSVDDSDEVIFTDPDSGEERKGSGINQGCISPRMKTEDNNEQRIRIFTRYSGDYNNRLISTNRLEDSFTEGNWKEHGLVYGKSISENDFQTQHTSLYNYVVENNVGVYPYLARDWNDMNVDGTYNYVLCMAFETYRDTDINNKRFFKIQNSTYVGFSPSFLDHNYIMPMNLDTPYVAGPYSTPAAPNQDHIPSLGYTPSIRKQDNMNWINIGASPSIIYNPELNRFQWQYLHTGFKFNEITGVDQDLEEEVGFLNSDKLMFFQQGIGELNLESGGSPETTSGDPPVTTPAVAPTSVHMGLADSQCGIFIKSLYGQTPRNSYIATRDNGVEITRDNYTNTLFWTLGFSYYDLRPIRFSTTSFNNRFNPNTFNTISGAFKTLGTSPFTTNSAIDVSDQQKTNIFTGVYFTRKYNTSDPYEELPSDPDGTGLISNPIGGTPAFYLGYNNLLSTSIKTTSALMTSKSVIVNLTSPFYRIYCNLPLDTLTYLSSGSLSCAGYMTKNYQSQSFIYSFASDYGGYLTRDVMITDLRTEIRDPRGLLVNSIDSNSAVFYKVSRNIALQTGLTEKQEKEQAELLAERQQQEAQEATEIRTVSMDVIKYFKQLFNQTGGAGTNNRDLTAALGEPSGVDEVYQNLSTRSAPGAGDVGAPDVETKMSEMSEANRPVVPTLDWSVLSGMSVEEEDERYTPRQHRLWREMSVMIDDALNQAQTVTPHGIVELTNLEEDIRQLSLGGSVLKRLTDGLGHINDRKELRKLVENIAIMGMGDDDTHSEVMKRATKIMRMLKVAQDKAMEANPELMGKNPFKRGRRTKKQMQEARGMGAQDVDAPEAKQTDLIIHKIMEKIRRERGLPPAGQKKTEKKKSKLTLQMEELERWKKRKAQEAEQAKKQGGGAGKTKKKSKLTLQMEEVERWKKKKAKEAEQAKKQGGGAGKP